MNEFAPRRLAPRRLAPTRLARRRARENRWSIRADDGRSSTDASPSAPIQGPGPIAAPGFDLTPVLQAKPATKLRANTASGPGQAVIQRVDSDDEEWEPSEEDQNQRIQDERDDMVPANKRKQFFPSGFYKETRPALMNRQGFTIGEDGKGELNMPDGSKMPMRRKKKNKKEWVEDRQFEKKEHQPDIDHETDVLLLQEHYDQAGLSDMSDDEDENFRSFLYNYPDNLSIKSKKVHKSKKTYRGNQDLSRFARGTKKFIKKARRDYKSNVSGRLAEKELKLGKHDRIEERIARAARERYRKKKKRGLKTTTN